MKYHKEKLFKKIVFKYLNIFYYINIMSDDSVNAFNSLKQIFNNMEDEILWKILVKNNFNFQTSLDFLLNVKNEDVEIKNEQNKQNTQNNQNNQDDLIIFDDLEEKKFIKKKESIMEKFGQMWKSRSNRYKKIDNQELTDSLLDNEETI